MNSLLNKIQNSFKFSYAQKGLIAKLSLTIGYIYKIDDINSIFAKDFFISAINNAPSENFINKKELATIYMFLGGLLADSDKRSLEKGIEYAKKSMNLFDGIQNSERYLITNLRYLSNAYIQKNDFNKAKSYLSKALSIAYTIKNEKERNINLAYIYKYMSSLYLKTGKTKENLKTSRALMEKALLLLKSKEFFYKTHKRPREFLHSVSCKRRLGKLCNHMELYQEALEHLKDAEYLINLAPHDTNNYHVMLGIIFCEQGISLLRLNSLQEAERLLKKSLKMLESTEHYNSIIRIKLVLIEDLIRLGKLNEAYEVCQYIFSIKDIEDNNYTVMLYNTCYYNAAIIQYKLFHLPQAITYFQKFFELSKGFCKTFLSEKVYQELVAENVFEKVENTSEIDKCLQNSLKIFTAIYGEKHSFIENYVKKTLSKP